MSARTGAHALLDALVEQGTRYLFGIPGVHTLPLYDALADCPDIRPVVTRHEAGAAFAADGYARLSGRPGVVSVVPGPGALNAATAVLCAWSDRVPMIVLTPVLDASGREAAVHEGDLEVAYRPFTKAQLRIDTSADVASRIRQACEVATRAPAGPVQILFSLPVLKERATEAAAQGPASAQEDDAAPAPTLGIRLNLLPMAPTTRRCGRLTSLGAAGLRCSCWAWAWREPTKQR
jgi:acetolactate synthase-1/2/3 large subunit